MPRMPNTALSLGLSLGLAPVRPLAIPVVLTTVRPVSTENTPKFLKRTKDIVSTVLEIVIIVKGVLQVLREVMLLYERLAYQDDRRKDDPPSSVIYLIQSRPHIDY
jgi:hypothetical protein